MLLAQIHLVIISAGMLDKRKYLAAREPSSSGLRIFLLLLLNFLSFCTAEQSYEPIFLSVPFVLPNLRPSAFSLVITF